MLQKVTVLIAQVYVLIMTVIAWVINIPVLKWYGIGLLLIGTISILLYHHYRRVDVRWIPFLGMILSLFITAFVMIKLGGITQSGGLVFVGAVLIILSLMFESRQGTILLSVLYLITIVGTVLIQPFTYQESQLSHINNILFFGGNILLLNGFILILSLSLFKFKDRRDDAVEARNNRDMGISQIKSGIYAELNKTLNSPIDEIIALTNKMLASDGKTDEDKLLLIKDKGKFLLLILEQLKDIAEIETNKTVVTKIQSDIIGFTNFIGTSFKAFAEKKHISLTFKSNVNQFNVDFDPEKIQKIFSPLLSDAITRTSEKGEIAVSVNREQENSFKDLVEVIISYPGKNLSPEMITLINEGEAQELSDENADNFIPGLGYLIAGKLIRMLGGKVFARSKKEKGNSFRIHLPVQNSQPFIGLNDLIKTMEIVPYFMDQTISPAEPTVVDSTNNSSEKITVEDINHL